MANQPPIDPELLDAHRQADEARRFSTEPSPKDLAKALRKIPNAELYTPPKKKPMPSKDDPNADLNKYI
jgi:hypothetical protein